MEKKQRLWILIGIGIVAWLIIIFGAYYYFSDETQDKRAYRSELKKLESQLVKLSNLHNKLTKKKKEIFLTRKELRVKIKEYREEVLQSSKIKNLSTYARAENDQQIGLNLKLIQINLAYVAKLEQTEHVIATGNNEIFFLKRKFQTDYKVATVLNRAEIKTLLGEVNLAIEKYMPYAGELVLNIDNIELKSTKQIWQDIVKGKKSKATSAKPSSKKINNYDFLNKEGVRLDNAGKYEAALKKFREAEKLKPNSGRLQNNICIVLVRLGKIESAMIAFHNAWHLGTRDPANANNIAVALSNKKLDRGAIEYYQKAIELDPNNSMFFRNIAIVYYNLREYRKAERHLNRAIYLEKNNYKSLKLLIRIYDKLNDKAMKKKTEERLRRLKKTGKHK